MERSPITVGKWGLINQRVGEFYTRKVMFCAFAISKMSHLPIKTFG
jgi:hypothetical protein